MVIRMDSGEGRMVSLHKRMVMLSAANDAVFDVESVMLLSALAVTVIVLVESEVDSESADVCCLCVWQEHSRVVMSSVMRASVCCVIVFGVDKESVLLLQSYALTARKVSLFLHLLY